jgi:hypothetical protein
MKATIKLENIISDNNYARLAGYKKLCNLFGYGELMEGVSFPRPWVAQITGFDPKYKYQRNFLRGTRDYSESNSKGTSGFYSWYNLESGCFYEINELTRKKTERYFCKVDELGNIIIVDEIDLEEYCAEQEEKNDP